MKYRKPLALLAGLAVAAASVIVASPASAVQGSYANPLATGGTSINSIDVNYAADTLTLTAHVQGLPGQFEFDAYFTPNGGAFFGPDPYIVASVKDQNGSAANTALVSGSNGSRTAGDPSSVHYSRDNSAGTISLSLPSSAVPWGSDVYASAALIVESGGEYFAGPSANGSGLPNGWGPIQKGQIGTSTTIAGTAGKEKHGSASVTFFGTVAPASAPGTIQFFDGATLIGSVAQSDGVAALAAPVTLANGKHQIHAVFVSADPNFASSTSGAVPLKVVAAGKSTKTKIHLASAYQHYKKKGVRISVKLSSKHAAGKVVLYTGKKKLTSAKLKKGKAHLTVPKKLSRGTHKLTVKYFPANSDAYKTSRSKVVRVTVLR